MKKTLFITMLAAALMGGQVFAAYIPTTTDADMVDDGFYVGVYNQTADVSGANVTINEEEDGGEDFSGSRVYGGFTEGEQAIASNNSVTMTGGQVAAVEGGYSSSGDATYNTVTVSGGQVDEVYGGYSYFGNANNNSVTITGGHVTSCLYGGYGTKTGNGNTVTITGGQVDEVYGGMGNEAANGNTVVLSSCTVNGYVFAAKANGACTDNAIEIYGTGTTAKYIGGMQLLNFHIADGVLISQKAMVNLTSTSNGEGLNLTGVELGFNAADVEDWGKYEGKSITLVTAAQSITIDAGSLGKVAIKDANGTTVATATLGLGGSDAMLSLSNIKGATPVPEPGTGVLGLLALAGLCIRRRK